MQILEGRMPYAVCRMLVHKSISHVLKNKKKVSLNYRNL